jgi:endonuclease YncB( thermonuclease family)
MRRRRRRGLLSRGIFIAIGLVLVAALWRSAPHEPAAFGDWALGKLARAGDQTNAAIDAVGRGGDDEGDRPGARQQAVVDTVVAGDTLVVTPTGPGVLRVGQQATVRLLGVDPAPAGHGPCAAGAATTRAQALLAPNVAVTLERDQLAADRTGRPLRHVWVAGRLLNAQLVREGVATVPRAGAVGRYEQLLKLAQATAQTHRVGVWGPTCAATAAAQALR